MGRGTRRRGQEMIGLEIKERSGYNLWSDEMIRVSPEYYSP
jgi:hypothetical protein